MLDKECGYYMAIGVGYDEFWNGDYTALKYYVHAHKVSMEEKNRMMWVQGFYVHDAVSTALHNALRAKGTAPESYRKEPIRITEMDEIEKEQEAEKIHENFKAQLMALTGRLERREQERIKEAEAKKEVEALLNGS